MGKILSEMAVDGKSSYDISEFKINRPAITDPNFESQLVIGGGAGLAKLWTMLSFYILVQFLVTCWHNIFPIYTNV